MHDWGWAETVDDISGQIAIAGVGESDHTKASARGELEIALQAAERAIADAGLEPSDVDGLMHQARMGEPLDTAAFHDHFGTDHDIWESPEGGGMVWAGTAPLAAARAIREGRARHVLNTFAVAWASQRGQMVGGPGQAHADHVRQDR